MKLVNKIDTSTLDWKNFRFMVFDQPNHPGTYQQRFNSIGISQAFSFYFTLLLILSLFLLIISVEHMKEHECKYIGIAEKVVCQGNEHLESFFQDVIDKGGEGIILRDPQSFLQPGRSPSYLKHKVFLIPFLSLISFSPSFILP